MRDKLIKALANLGAKRAPLLPDLATAQEQGMAGFDAGSWNVVFLPKGTPRADRAASSTRPSARRWTTPATRERLHKLGIDIPAKDRRSPAYAAKFVQSEIKKYEGPIKAAGIVIE